MQKHQRLAIAFFYKLKLILLFDLVIHGQLIRCNRPEEFWN
jgi:hypothetical protein